MTSHSKLFIIFFLFFFYTTFATSSTSLSNNTIHKLCPKKESEALLLFKHSLSSFNSSRDNCWPSRPLMMRWNTSTDCCNWPGVTCNNSTGEVIALDLFCGRLQGTLHPNTSLFNHLPRLTYLSLLGNKLNGTLPSWLFASPSLQSLDLSDNMFSGIVPFESFALPSLKRLYLGYNQLDGDIPSDISINLTHLTSLDISSNRLNGTLPSWLFTFPYLEYLNLENNMFSGNVPFHSFALPSVKFLYLRYNQLGGQIDMQTFQQLTNLTQLFLEFNNFSGELELDMLLSSLKNLEWLILSYSGFSVTTKNANHYVNPGFQNLHLASCKLKVFPNSLRAMKQLEYLDLSNNEIHGPIPNWAGEIGGNNGLYYLNLSHNFITGLPQFQSYAPEELYLQSNLIQGSFPTSICNIRNLEYLDMSNNQFGGLIPQCFGNITSSLRMINMGNNSFQGTIPSLYGDCENLQGLILKGNLLQGELPSSWSKCQSLKVVDLGNNHLNGTFPEWLGDLPNLQALVLKSNNFHGHIQTFVDSPFPSLQVLDLSHNRFVGQLPTKYFRNFNSMKNVAKNSTTAKYLSIGDYLYYSFVVAVKGLDQFFTKISVDYTIIDMSNNTFEGQIPDVIGGLNSLIVLNLSHNSLIGPIPHALGNLTEIESLDLSWNQLSGEIPQSLARISALEVLNLSQNHLVGRIPGGPQFNGFSTSFGGNSGLYGFPLPDREHQSSPQFEDDDDGEKSGFTWKVVMLGYGCGTILGLVIGYLMLSTTRPNWLNAIAEAGEHIILKRRDKRRMVYMRK